MRRAALAVLGLAVPLGCGHKDDGSFRLSTSPPATTTTSDADQPPVAINPVSPVEYPVPLLEQGIEGRVLLRLYADSQGTLVGDSTRVAESSGYPALDSAAVSGTRDCVSPPRSATADRSLARSCSRSSSGILGP